MIKIFKCHSIIYLLITLFLFSCSNDKLNNQKKTDTDLINAKYKQDTVSKWIGGFEQSNMLFPYPNPNLKSLHMLDNMANIDKLKRQLKVLWPEFSWKTNNNDENTRLFALFEPDVSRIGYDDRGRIFSIICPQFGFYSHTFGTLNAEVTVTGNRGWVNENTKELAADMTVLVKFWFSGGSMDNVEFQLLKKLFERENLPLPMSKNNAIVVSTNLPNNINNPIFPVKKGLSQKFNSPKFALHENVAWNVANLSAEVGSPVKIGNEIVDDFNSLYLEFLNFSSGNFAKKGTILTWNLWFTEPENVNQEEWRNHAIKWRESIDSGYLTLKDTPSRYYDGTLFAPKDQRELEIEALKAFLKKHL